MKTKTVGLHSLNGIDFQTLAVAYQTIYGARPWSEFKKCLACGKQWGVEQKHELESIQYVHCGTELSDYWPTKDLFDQFEDISAKPSFAAAIAYDGQKIVGFGWGYEVSIDELDCKLELEGIAKAVIDMYGKTVRIGYLADLAVDADYRGAGLAKNLTRIRHDVLHKNSIDVVLTRTKGGSDPSVTHLWYDKIGFNILIHYNDEKSRVIRSSHIEELKW